MERRAAAELVAIWFSFIFVIVLLTSLLSNFELCLIVSIPNFYFCDLDDEYIDMIADMIQTGGGFPISLVNKLVFS